MSVPRLAGHVLGLKEARDATDHAVSMSAASAAGGERTNPGAPLPRQRACPALCK